MSDQPAADGAPRQAPARRAGRGNRAWIMAALVLGAAGAALLVLEQRAPEPPTPGTGAPGEPDFYMEGAEIHQYRSDGTLEYRLVSEEVRHFEHRSETRLRDPRLALLEADGPPWEIRARTGVLHRPHAGGDEETVSLRSDVVLQRTRDDGEYVRLTTSALDVYPHRQYAETDRDVIIDSLVGRTTANGLEGDLQLGMLTFHSSDERPVSTVLQPDQFK